jgi:hypothetical protein
MSLFKKISDYFTSPSSADEASYWVYVRCNKCNEPLKVRVNLHHDLSVDYDGPKGQSYFSRKTIVGRTGCFQRIEIELIFNQKRKLTNREVAGGTYIDEDVYLAEVANQAP